MSEPYTININNGTPIQNGLFCEKIFGPILSWQCKCGLFNSLSPLKKNYLCPLCSSENTNSVVRRYRLGYIYLNCPVFHTLYVDNNILGLIAGVPQRELLKLAYFIPSNTVDSIFNNYSLSQLLFPSHYVRHRLSNINLINKVMETRNKLSNSSVFAQKEGHMKSLYLMNLFLLNNINPE